MLSLDRAPEAVLLEFLNSVDIEEGTDVCAAPDTWDGWLRTQGVHPDQAPRERCRALRDELRAWVTGEAGIAVSLPLGVALHGRGRDDTTVVLQAPDLPGLIGAAVARLQVERRLDRVKICPADDCRWAFYDQSRNRSRTWCSMEVCGNRAKARTHASRQHSGSSAAGPDAGISG